ncbi:MAG: SMC family ATPase [Anaerolineales bacterium]|nr:SMC family ATPase [Anaerolineales bacterium]
MIPLQLELENFLSYRRQVKLDLSGMHLACIAGENGAGKSSLLDAMTWVLFGKCRAPGRDDVVNRQAVPSGDSARVQMDFMLEGETYRVVRIQPPGKTGILEFQMQLDGGAWRSLTETSIRNTQEQLEALLRMNYETFTNASFLLQGRADEFTIKRPGERKRILGDLLGVSHWELYKEEAASRRRETENTLSALQSRLEEIESELQQEPERKKRLSLARIEHEAARKERESQERLVQSIQAYQSAVKQHQILLNTLQNNKRQTERTCEQLQATLQDRRQEETRLQVLLSDSKAIEERYALWQEAEKEVQTWDAKAAAWNRLNTEKHQIVLEIEKIKSKLEQEHVELQRRQQESASKQENKTKLAVELEQVTAQGRALRERAAARPALQETLGELQSRMGAINNDQPRLKKEMEKKKSRQVQLQSEESRRCPLCDQELTLEHRAAVIAQIEEEGLQLGDQYRANQAEMSRLQVDMSGVRDELKEIDRIENELHRVERQETSVKTQLAELDRWLSDWFGSGQPRLAEVNDRLKNGSLIPESQIQLAKIDRSIQDLAYKVDSHNDARRRMETLADSKEPYHLLGQARAALRPLRDSIKDLETQISHQNNQIGELDKQINEAEKDLQSLGPAPATDLAHAELELNRCRETEVRASKAIGAAEQSLRALEDLRGQKKELNHRRQQTSQLVSQLKILERSFGRNGVQALLIEQALPAIEENANRLLDRLTAGEMRVTFSTQRQLKSRDAMAETLDISISDNVGERPYEMYSGGEAFRVNFAIRIALSRLLAQRAGARLQTLVIDEGFGSQDPEGRQRLVEAINIIQSDFDRVLVITHIDALKDAFPVRIQVTKGADGSQVEII